MKHLVIFAHPNPKSFNFALLETIVTASESNGNEVIVRDLYGQKFNALLDAPDFEAFQKGEIPDDLKVEQEFITWAEHITFVHPVWWAGLPAMLKGYIDRVFSMGFAYAYTPEGPVGLLAGKSVSIVSTCGSPIELYEASGMARSISQVWNDGILKFCGLELIFYRLWGNVIQADSDERQKMLEETNKLVTTHCRAGRIE